MAWRGKTYLFRNIKEIKKKSYSRKIQWRKEAEELGLRGKPIKHQDKKSAPSTSGHRRPFEQRRVPCLGLPLSWILTAGASKQTWRASTPQMGIQPENRVRKEDTGETSLSNDWLLLYCPERRYIPFDCTQRSMDNTKLCSISSLDSYRDQAFSRHTQLYTQVLGDVHHLLARGPVNILQPFSDKGNSGVLPKVWCHSQKALNKVTFLRSKDTTIYNKKVEQSDL